MKTVLALSLVLMGAQAFAASPSKAFSQGMTDLVMRLPKDPTGVDLTCSSESGRTGLFATLPGDLKGTAIVVKNESSITTDVDAAYVGEAKAREFDVQSELSKVNVTKIEETEKALVSKTAKETRLSLVTIAGSKRSVIRDGGAEGKVTFRALLSTGDLKNVEVNCVKEWSL